MGKIEGIQYKENPSDCHPGDSFVLAFLIAVAAGVACHYINKWLDRDDKDNQ